MAFFTSDAVAVIWCGASRGVSISSKSLAKLSSRPITSYLISSGIRILVCTLKWPSYRTSLRAFIKYRAKSLKATTLDSPRGTIGYSIGRSVSGGAEETIYQTGNVIDRGHTDRPAVGGEEHTYVLYSEFSNGRSVSSEPKSVTILNLRTNNDGSLQTGYDRYVNFSTPNAAGSLNLAPDRSIAHVISGTTQNRVLTDSEILIDDFNPVTLDASPAFGVQDQFIVTGQSLSRNQAFISLHPPTEAVFPESTLSFEWERASAPDSRVLVTWAGPYGFPGQIVVLEGKRVRTFNDQLELTDEQEGPREGAIGLEYVDRALWAAYPDALMKSSGDPVSGSTLGPWESVTLPPSTTVTAITRMHEDKIVLLDGTNSLLHVIGSDGEILLSLAAPGDNLVGGDVFWHWRSGGGSWLFLVDGVGLRYGSEALPAPG